MQKLFFLILVKSQNLNLRSLPPVIAKLAVSILSKRLLPIRGTNIFLQALLDSYAVFTFIKRFFEFFSQSSSKFLIRDCF